MEQVRVERLDHLSPNPTLTLLANPLPRGDQRRKGGDVGLRGLGMGEPGHDTFAQFIGLCSSLKWSSHLTKSPFLALSATAGSNAAYKIISACSNAVS